MDSAFMQKAFALIANGLIEKEQIQLKEPTRYPYSRNLQHGINMFLAASQRHGSDIYAEYADETSFLVNFITKPIKEWFDTWKLSDHEKNSLKEETFYNCGAFAYQKADNLYLSSEDCYEFLSLQDNNIIDGTDERIFFEMIYALGQEGYTKIRKYVIENPIITLGERQNMSIEFDENKAAFQFAYEEITEESYRCKRCGWAMIKGKYGYICYSNRCKAAASALSYDMKPDVHRGDYRLKKGIMQFIAAPGKLELEIVKFCEKYNLKCELWPQMDRYDVEIMFPDGEVWEIDAKDYQNPCALREKINNDGGFPDGDYEQGFVVVPMENTKNDGNYTKIVNEALKNQKNVECVNFRQLKTEIKKRVESCHGK